MAVAPDLEELADYLDSDLSPDDFMSLSDLDGFLTAIVIGPELIMPNEWLVSLKLLRCVERPGSHCSAIGGRSSWSSL